MPTKGLKPSTQLIVDQLGETTTLSPDEEREFQNWVKQNGITDADNAESYYDYRGYWKSIKGAPREGDHFPDTYKQHGHPTFSQESKYSIGPRDGGMWIDETYLPQPRMNRSGR